jgi:hypothetical protein
MNLKRHKIKGISFHHRPGKRSQKKHQRFSDFFSLSELQRQLETESPTPFTPVDIRRLLGDHGRHEINSTISLCIELTTKWKGVLKVLERCFPEHAFMSSSFLKHHWQEEDSQSLLEQEIQIYLWIKKNLWIWKHNLHILQMTAQAQFYQRSHLS